MGGTFTLSVTRVNESVSQSVSQTEQTKVTQNGHKLASWLSDFAHHVQLMIENVWKTIFCLVHNTIVSRPRCRFATRVNFAVSYQWKSIATRLPKISLLIMMNNNNHPLHTHYNSCKLHDVIKTCSHKMKLTSQSALWAKFSIFMTHPLLNGQFSEKKILTRLFSLFLTLIYYQKIFKIFFRFYFYGSQPILSTAHSAGSWRPRAAISCRRGGVFRLLGTVSRAAPTRHPPDAADRISNSHVLHAAAHLGDHVLRVGHHQSHPVSNPPTQKIWSSLWCDPNWSIVSIDLQLNETFL